MNPELTVALAAFTLVALSQIVAVVATITITRVKVDRDELTRFGYN